MGVTLCFTIFSSSIASNIDVVTNIGKVFILRLKDRKFKRSVKKDIEDEEDDEPISDKATQEELE